MDRKRKTSMPSAASVESLESRVLLSATNPVVSGSMELIPQPSDARVDRLQSENNRIWHEGRVVIPQNTAVDFDGRVGNFTADDFESSSFRKTLLAGEEYEVYVIHLDRISTSGSSPTGTVTFDNPIAGIAAFSSSLNRTDFSDDTDYEGTSKRGLEGSGQERISISNGGKTIQVRFTSDTRRSIDEIRVFVKVGTGTPPVNNPPVVNAGTDQNVTTLTANLNGTVTDDGSFTTTWTQVSGPGTATFGNSSAIDTSASFSAAGTYVLRLTANDGTNTRFDEVQIVASTTTPPTNTPPNVSAGSDQTVTGTSAALNGTVTDNGTFTTFWSKVSGPGTVTFANSVAIDTNATFGSAGTYVLRLTANDGQFVISDDVQVIVNDTQPPTVSQGVWMSRDEIMALPMSGTAWTGLVSAANQSAGSADISNQDSNHDVYILAKALVGVRTNNASMIEAARAGIMAAINTENGGRTLALGRNLTSYVIAADIVGLSSTQDAQFRTWLRGVVNENLSGMTLVGTHEDRPNNWGTHAGSALAAAAVYLGDNTMLQRVADVFEGWLGNRSVYAGFDYGDTSWQSNPNAPVGINPKGATIDGHNVDGVLPDDQRRGGSFSWPAPQENYVYEALQGTIVTAEILHRKGFDVYNWQDKAILRAYTWLNNTNSFPAAGDDRWQMNIVNARYGTNFASTTSANFGKNMGWTSWTHQGGSSSSTLVSATSLITEPVETTEQTDTDSVEKAPELFLNPNYKMKKDRSYRFVTRVDDEKPFELSDVKKKDPDIRDYTELDNFFKTGRLWEGN